MNILKPKGVMQCIGIAIDEAVSDGTTFHDFQKKIEPVLQKNGLWDEYHSPRWLQIIFETCLRSAYAATKWKQIQATKDTHPYLRYLAVQDNQTHPECRALNNIVLPVDDPFWNDFYPYGCRCTVQALSERALEQQGLSITTDADLQNFIENQRDVKT